jgi:hypothetical protein
MCQDQTGGRTASRVSVERDVTNQHLTVAKECGGVRDRPISCRDAAASSLRGGRPDGSDHESRQVVPGHGHGCVEHGEEVAAC